MAYTLRPFLFAHHGETLVLVCVRIRAHTNHECCVGEPGINLFSLYDVFGTVFFAANA